MYPFALFKKSPDEYYKIARRWQGDSILAFITKISSHLELFKFIFILL